jgi:Flp pilus assembly protein TadD
MIVRDGGQNLASLLASAHPWVDEIVIGDTGSRDDSVEVAQEFGAQVRHLKWREDFAQARNQVLDHCRGAWILILDADELLCDVDWQELRDWVQTMQQERHYQAGNIVSRNYLPDRYSKRGWLPVPADDPHALAPGPPSEGFVTTAKVRLFPNRPEIRFQGQIHETVEASLWEAHIPIVDLPWPVHHFGYLEPSPAKNDRYLHLAHLKTTEQPHNPMAWAELADCAIAVDEYRQALVAIERSLVLDPSDPDHHLTAGWLLTELGDDDKAEVQLAAVAGYPDVDDHLLAEAAHLRAQIAIRRESPEIAAPLLAKAVQLFPNNGHYQNTLGTLHLLLGRGEAARSALERSCVMLPHRPEPCLNLALLLETAAQPEAAAAQYAEALRRDPENEQAVAGLQKNTPVPVPG